MCLNQQDNLDQQKPSDDMNNENLDPQIPQLAQLKPALRLQKNVLQVTDLDDEQDERLYWLAQSPTARLIALEQMRQIVYGYDPNTIRFQRVFTIIERP